MEEYVNRIKSSKKQTPVKVYLWENRSLDFPDCRVFSGGDGCKLIFGEWEKIFPVLRQNRVQDYIVESDRRFSALPMADLHQFSARIEPGALIREGVSIGKNAVILMGAILNIGAMVGDCTMVDMGAILGSGVCVGRDCHIGAGAVLAGVLEPASALPVTIEDRVLIGANAVVLEGVTVGADAVVGAGAVVTKDVLPGTVVAGNPAVFLKNKDDKTAGKTGLTDGLR